MDIRKYYPDIDDDAIKIKPISPIIKTTPISLRENLKQKQIDGAETHTDAMQYLMQTELGEGEYIHPSAVAIDGIMSLEQHQFTNNGILKMNSRYAAYGLGVEEISEDLEGAEETIAHNGLAEIVNEEVNVEEVLDEQKEDAIVALEALAVSIESIISAGCTTKHTAALVQQNMATNFGILGVSLEACSLENFTNDYVNYHVVALEGIRNVLQDIGNTIYINRMTGAHALNNTFRTYLSSAENYEAIIETIETDYNRKKPNFLQKVQEFSNAGLVKRFSKAGYSRLTFPDFKHDLDVSKYIIKDYGSAIIKSIEQLTNVCKHADFTNADAARKTVIDKIKGMKSPVDLFDKKYLGAGKYFGDTGFVVVRGLFTVKSKHEITDPIEHLAENTKIAVSSRFFESEEDRSTKEQILTINDPIIQSFVPTYKVEDKQFNELFDVAKTYVSLLKENLGWFDKNVVKIDRMFQEYNAAIERAGTLNGEVKVVAKMFRKVLKSFERAYYSPRKAEAKRILWNIQNVHYFAKGLVKRAR